MTSGMRITWAPAGSGWVACTVEDHQAKVELTASRLGNAPVIPFPSSLSIT
ncbi:hypothetical protein ACIQJ4_10460 [Streptomyces filamentosus]|uniref:hypothetical protein n=1 Tax=Streptomyces filamentosus TaxID=67294 RepID=UPI003819EC17